MAHIHWFRKGLRLHDNPALLAALQGCRELYPLFILDPQLHDGRAGANRCRFLIGALVDLDRSLRELNSRYGLWAVAAHLRLTCGFGSSRLLVVRGRPEDVLPKLFSQWSITRMSYEYDTEPYSLSRDRAVAALAKDGGVEVVYEVSHTLYDVDRYGPTPHLHTSGALTLAAFQDNRGERRESAAHLQQPAGAPEEAGPPQEAGALPHRAPLQR